MRKITHYLELGFTAALVILQPVMLLISADIMVVSPVLINVLRTSLEVSKYGRYIVSFIKLISNRK